MGIKRRRDLVSETFYFGSTLVSCRRRLKQVLDAVTFLDVTPHQVCAWVFCVCVCGLVFFR